MKFLLILCALVFAIPSFAGTFKDDFEDGDFEGWLITIGMAPFDPENTTLSVKNGVLFIRRPSGRSINLSIGNEKTWRNYNIECDVRITERIPNEWGNNYHYIGLIGRYIHENLISHEAIGFALNLTANPSVWKFVFMNGRDWLIDIETPFGFKINEWHHVKLVVKDDSFKFYVDGMLVDSINSSLIPTGRVSFCTGGCSAEYDNFVITGDQVPDVGPSGYAIKSKGKLTTTWGQMKLKN